MPLDRAAIARLIPHAGAMCLLDEVVAWDQNRITCSASSHRDPGNPLARNGRLAAIGGIEYAAQAMAVHGGLTGAVDGRPRRGYLASLRDVACSVAMLHDVTGELMIEAEKLMGEGSQVIYRFTVSCDAAPLVTGRAAVVLEA